ncbi:cobalt-precorrin-5B (C(1))-methyltransferase CbiD [uncultured Ruthenibacterium sp.]|uniref:cobalt-precorrin-5B (C(1))-methyltransferase CbiD n=1 Tax=uncultured Ruthenibacterium sp. TaxID=1905347 RepID=UPI00349E63A6
MSFEYYIQSGGKKLRCGYTTGTCAALAAAGATQFLLSKRIPDVLSIMTPKGIRVTVEPKFCRMEGDYACCAIEKDGGDDADVTNGAWIEACVCLTDDHGIQIEGGPGVGRVTRAGLDQPVGQAAINSVPRRMIQDAVQQICRSWGFEGGVRVVVRVPDGEKLAPKTFNPHLGIEGGISILGTSGIVEPMSTQALVDTIAISLRQARAQGAKRIVLTPGNYGEAFLTQTGMDQMGIPIIKCSNFIGDALDEIAVLEFEEVLLVGHAGKLVKLAGGIMNTHSRWADCRSELFCAHAAICGASQQICSQVMDAVTVDECIAVLDKVGLRQMVLESLLQEIERHLYRRAAGAYRIGAVLFTNQFGFLGQTKEAAKILAQWEAIKK